MQRNCPMWKNQTEWCRKVVYTDGKMETAFVELRAMHWEWAQNIKNVVWATRARRLNKCVRNNRFYKTYPEIN